MNAAEARPTVDDLAAALRTYADGDLTGSAAVNLLIAHGHWLRRTPFLRRVKWWPADDADPRELAAALWSQLEEMLDRDPDAELYDSYSERGVLRVACSIARGWLGNVLTSCDTTNVELIVHAVRTAGGARR